MISCTLVLSVPVGNTLPIIGTQIWAHSMILGVTCYVVPSVLKEAFSISVVYFVVLFADGRLFGFLLAMACGIQSGFRALMTQFSHVK